MTTVLKLIPTNHYRIPRLHYSAYKNWTCMMCFCYCGHWKCCIIMTDCVKLSIPSSICEKPTYAGNHVRTLFLTLLLLLTLQVSSTFSDSNFEIFPKLDWVGFAGTGVAAAANCRPENCCTAQQCNHINQTRIITLDYILKANDINITHCNTQLLTHKTPGNSQ